MTIDKLIEAIKEKKSPCIVGIDPEYEKLPACYKTDDPAPHDAVLQWAMDVIDAVRDIVPAVKPQIAFFEVYGADGIRIHQKIVEYAHRSGLLVIDDSKRGDIGNTARAYAYAHLAKNGPLNADFLTISPFLGTDSILPFLEVARRDGKGLFVLVKTSNPGSALISEAVTEGGKTLRAVLAEYVRKEGEEMVGKHGYSSLGAVVGATYPKEARELRGIMNTSFFLVPGYGAQGGEVSDILPCFNADGLGAIVNSSRGVLYHHLLDPQFDGTRESYLKIVKQQAERMRDEIYCALKGTYPHMIY